MTTYHSTNPILIFSFTFSSDSIFGISFSSLFISTFWACNLNRKQSDLSITLAKWNFATEKLIFPSLSGICSLLLTCSHFRIVFYFYKLMPNIKCNGSIPFDLFIFPMEILSLQWKVKMDWILKKNLKENHCKFRMTWDSSHCFPA